MIRSWMRFSCCSLKHYQNFMKNQEKKIELQKKAHRRICVRDITFLAARLPSYVIFLSIPNLRTKNLAPGNGEWGYTVSIKLHTGVKNK